MFKRFFTWLFNGFKKPTEIVVTEVPVLPILVTRHGVNANVSSVPRCFDSEEVRQAIIALIPEGGKMLLRVPGGGASNDFDYLTQTYANGISCRLEDIALLKDYVDVIFVLNMINETLASNIERLKKAHDLGITIRFIEFGNEYNNRGNSGRVKYPTATIYFSTCKEWASEIKKYFPTVIFICVGENKNTEEDAKNWNPTGQYIDPLFYLAWHCYPNPNLYVSDGYVDLDKLKAAIMDDYVTTGFDKVKNKAVTEYNIKNSDHEGDTAYVRPEEHTKAVIFIAKTLEELGVKIMCLHNLVGKVGVFDVTKNSIELLPSGQALKQILQ